MISVSDLSFLVGVVVGAVLALASLRFGEYLSNKSAERRKQDRGGGKSVTAAKWDRLD